MALPHNTAATGGTSEDGMVHGVHQCWNPLQCTAGCLLRGQAVSMASNGTVLGTSYFTCLGLYPPVDHHGLWSMKGQE